MTLSGPGRWTSLDVALSSALPGLFEGLPHIMFCIKDTRGRYLMVNQAFADRVRRATPAEVIGLTASELFPHDLAATYEAQDREAIATGRGVRHHLEVVLRPDGTRGWYLTNKVALTGESGCAIGVASLSVDLRSPSDSGSDLEALAAVLDLVRSRFDEPLSVEQLAEAGNLTPLQLERRMRRVLGMSPKQFLLRVRLEEAMMLLATTTLTISDVAARCGYYDQSSLARQFRRVVGLTPGQYRANAARPL